MLVNQKNGQLNLAQNLSVFRYMPIKEFTSREDYSLWENIMDSEFMLGYMNEYKGYMDQKINVSLFFLRTFLWCVELSFFLPTEQKSRFRESDYPNADALRWRFHEKFLRSELGDPPYNYQWGFISLGNSQFDKFSIIHIEYT